LQEVSCKLEAAGFEIIVPYAALSLCGSKIFRIINPGKRQGKKKAAGGCIAFKYFQWI